MTLVIPPLPLYWSKPLSGWKAEHVSVTGRKNPVGVRRSNRSPRLSLTISRQVPDETAWRPEATHTKRCQRGRGKHWQRRQSQPACYRTTNTEKPEQCLRETGEDPRGHTAQWQKICLEGEFELPDRFLASLNDITQRYDRLYQQQQRKGSGEARHAETQRY